MITGPFSNSHFLGYVNFVSPSYVKVHFPSSLLMKSFTHHAETLRGGLVGNHVVIEGEEKGFLGKILEVSLPERERLELSERTFSTKDFHPTGRIEILLTFDLYQPNVLEKGISNLPLIGSKVFICSSDFLASHFKGFGVRPEHLNNTPIFRLGYLAYDKSVPVDISLQALFSRHCAVVGTTGGGKSYTVSKFLEGVISSNAKAIILDPTGEYSSFDNHPNVDKSILVTNSFFPYQNLTINDLFVLFRPSGQVQQPVLLEAIKSLKVAQCLLDNRPENGHRSDGGQDIFSFRGQDVFVSNGVIVKQNNLTAAFNNAYFTYKEIVENFAHNHFDISKLHRQIANECYQVNNDRWSNFRDDRNYSNATSLIVRVNNVLSDNIFSRMFGFNRPEGDNVITKINNFVDSNELNVLRIGFEDVPFNFQVREILANSLGRYLLNKARSGIFRERPLVMFVDEAHQFLNKRVKDEYFESTDLNAFDNIAKESRKFGLFLCLATQMPRDIPVGTLSQMGTFVSHRLINSQDKDAIASACSTANKETLAFLPSLGSGEAIIMGVDFPMPISVKVDRPSIVPLFDTPRF